MSGRLIVGRLILTVLLSSVFLSALFAEAFVDCGINKAHKIVKARFALKASFVDAKA